MKEGIKDCDPLYLNLIDDTGYLEPQDAFAALIGATHGKDTWNSNPFVWRYKFKLIK
jgi:hypothetical protein